MTEYRYYHKGNQQYNDLWVIYWNYSKADAWRNGEVVVELPVTEEAAERVRKALEEAYRRGRVHVAEEFYGIAGLVVSNGGQG